MFIFSFYFVVERNLLEGLLPPWPKKNQISYCEYKKIYWKFNSPIQRKKTLWSDACTVINVTFHIPVSKGAVQNLQKYKDASKRTSFQQKEYEYAAEMDEIFGISHSINPTFVVKVVQQVPLNPKAKMRPKEPSPTSIINTNTTSENTKRGYKGKSGGRERKH